MILYPTRLQMLESLVAPNSVILEVGVFRGEFAAQLYQTLAPRKLILCDPWDGPSISGDADGNNVISVDLRAVYAKLEEVASQNSDLVLLRGRSPEALKGLADACLDVIYIDGCHSYEGVSADLEEALRLVRPGGYICGHDLEMNPAKTTAHYEFGVKRAVEEFCARHGLTISAKGMDGCVSYAIRR